MNTGSAILVGVLSGDDVQLSGGTAAFADKHVGPAEPVSVSALTLTGAQAANYALASSSASTSANITPRALLVSATGVDKVYDGTTTATVTLSDDRVAGDTLSDSYSTATFANRNVGPAKAVSVSGISLTGDDAADYTHNATAATLASITARALTVTAVSDVKLYDGSTTSTGSPALGGAGLVSGDSAVFTQSFDTKNVGTAKTLTPAGSVTDGNAGLNYNVSLVSVNTGRITLASLTITADHKTKLYGTANPALTVSYSGFVGGDTATALSSPVTLSTTAALNSPAGDYTITADGAVAQNYTLTYVDGTLTVVSAPQLTSVSGQDGKVLFTFLSTTGQRYQVEAADGLSQPAWASLGDPISGTGAPVTVTNEITGPQRFFRLKVTPVQGN